MPRIVRTVVILTALLLAAVAQAATPESLRVTADATTVTVSGVTPGESVVVFCVTRETRNYVHLLRRHQAVVVDGERAGKITYQPPDGIAAESIIAAVEIGSGRIAVGSRPEVAPRELGEDAGHGFGRGINGELNRLQKRGQFCELLVVRPGTGAWTMKVGDGGQADRDHSSDHAVTIDVDELLPVEGAAAATPKQFRPGDVVFGVETHEFAYFVAGVR